jgi:hypothetical protein
MIERSDQVGVPGLHVPSGSCSKIFQKVSSPPQQWEAGHLSRESLGRKKVSGPDQLKTRHYLIQEPL